MLEPPVDIDASEGETVAFTCRLTVCMPPPSVVWYFETVRTPAHSDRRQLFAGDKYQLRVSADGVASLVVADIRQSDAGVYTMCAASSAGTVEVSAMLSVHGQCMSAVNSLATCLTVLVID